MPGQFNPDKNLFSVAPVGQIIIIGRSTSLRGGLSREYALNLATWLLISAGATPEEVRAGIQDAMTGKPADVGKSHKALVGAQRTIPQAPPPKALAAEPAEVSPMVAGQVAPFIGDVDKEEAEGIKAALPEMPTVPVVAGQLKIPVINPDDVASAWGGSNG